MRTKILFLLLCIIAYWSCAGSLEIDNLKCKDTKDSIEVYAEKNRATLISTQLSNGIPVIIKKNNSNQIMNLKILFEGHTEYTPLDKAGIEALTLSMLTKGSKSYPYNRLKDILFRKSTSITPEYKNFNYTSFNLNTLDKYFPELLKVFADSLLNPEWNEKEFKNLINDKQMSLQKNLNEPYYLANTNLLKQFFKGHPYAASWDGTLESLKSIKLDDLKDYYAKNLQADRMSIIAVGNYDKEELIPQLEKYFGKLKTTNSYKQTLKDFFKSTENKLILKPFEQSKGVAFVIGDFPIPAPTHIDYPATEIGFEMLNDLLFEHVRTQHGAAYSVAAKARAFKANYGSLIVFKTSSPEKVKKYIDEAIKVLVGGKCLAAQINASAEGKGGIGTNNTEKKEAAYVPIEEALQFYLDQFVTSFYSGQQTNSSIADAIANSYISTNQPDDYLNIIQRLREVKAIDIQRVIKKYVYENNITWMILGSEDTIKPVNEDDFKK